jgi:hypothetical protein
MERADVDAILAAFFDVNAALSRIDENLETITKWLKEDDDEEEEGDSPEPF